MLEQAHTILAGLPERFLTKNMATPPIINVGRLHQALIMAGVTVVSVNSNGIVQPANLQTAAQVIINAFDDSTLAQVSSDNIQARATASTIVDTDKTANTKLLRAIAAVLLDEQNLHALKINEILTAIDNGATLAQVKTNIAGITDYPQRTMTQVVAAIKNKINSGDVD
jgi:hypothetical protein